MNFCLNSKIYNTYFCNLESMIVDEETITLAQTLIDKYKLSPRNSMHVASALGKKINQGISDDEDSDQVKEIVKTSLI
ncbi:MAG: hypothetical protein QXE05_00630 [Nitrososphaeria archaeon]